MNPTRPIAATLLTLAAATGCAVNPRAGFAPVADTIHQRTGQQLHWNTDRPEDAAAQTQLQSHINQLLAGELTPDDAVQIALLNNPELQATYEDLGIAQADLVQAGLLANPVFSASLRFPARPHYPVDVNIEEDFVGLLFLPLRKSVAEAAFQQTAAQVTDTLLRHAAQTRAAFYRLQGALQLLDLRKNVLDAADANLDASRRLRDAGNTRELDLANDQALVAQARIDLESAEADAADAREDLTALMGLWGPRAATWKVAPRLPDPPAQPLPLPGLESLAIRQRQNLLAARNGLLALSRQAGFANIAALLSGSTLGIDLVRDADVATTLGPSVSATLPLFDQGQATAARIHAQFRQARARYLALAIDIRSQIRKAHEHLAIAQARAAYYKDFVIPLRHRIVEETQLQYNGMLAGLFVLLQAKQEEINAGAHYVEAVRDYWVARAQLEQAVGGHLPDSPAAPLPPPTGPQTAPPPEQTNTSPAMEHMHTH